MFTVESDGAHAATLMSMGIVVPALQLGQMFRRTDMPVTIPDSVWNVLQKRKHLPTLPEMTDSLSHTLGGFTGWLGRDFPNEAPMFPFNRKDRTQSKKVWNQVKSEYEEAIRRCYKWNTVTLALCGFQRFLAFNFKHGFAKERSPFVEDDFRFWGVVHEQDQFSKHVRCEIKIEPEASGDDHVGWFVLTHINVPGDRTPCEEQAVQLEVTLHDPTSMLKASLIDGLRDAALSGFRFMHIRFECPESTNEEFEQALSDMRAKGYSPTRKILAVKMGPKIELQNAPKWSRPED